MPSLRKNVHNYFTYVHAERFTFFRYFESPWKIKSKIKKQKRQKL